MWIQRSVICSIAAPPAGGITFKSDKIIPAKCIAIHSSMRPEHHATRTLRIQEILYRREHFTVLGKLYLAFTLSLRAKRRLRSRKPLKPLAMCKKIHLVQKLLHQRGYYYYRRTTEAPAADALIFIDRVVDRARKVAVVLQESCKVPATLPLARSRRRNF